MKINWDFFAFIFVGFENWNRERVGGRSPPPSLFENRNDDQDNPEFWERKFSLLLHKNIDNSRTGLDTSKNQCSAPAVTALKKY